MRDLDRVLAPNIVQVSFSLEPVPNILDSFTSISHVDRLSGLSEWVNQTAASMSPERRQINKLLFHMLDLCCQSITMDKNWPTFQAYLEDLPKQDPFQLRDLIITSLRSGSMDTLARRLTPPSAEEILGSFETYISWIKTLYPDHEIEMDLAVQAHALLNDPVAMLNLFISHLHVMWHGGAAAEWSKNLPMLEESVSAFNEMDYSGQTALDAIRAVTGRDLRGKWELEFANLEHLIFVPSSHIGPYVSKFGTGPTARLIFGARLPKGVRSAASSALSRSELLVRINGLADDTRLRILQLLVQEGELCAQDIITRLGVSQSSMSRHLSQLSATGYLTERRREVSKCYSLNTERIDDTLRALSHFLNVNR